MKKLCIILLLLGWLCSPGIGVAINIGIAQVSVVLQNPIDLVQKAYTHFTTPKLVIPKGML